VLFAILSAVVTLAALELGLRAAGWVVLRRTRVLREHGSLRILCVGDSYTYGMGTAPNLYSWPRQLETLLRRRNPGLDVTVRNMGVPGRSSSEIRAELPGFLEETDPQIVCVLAGLNDVWNRRAALEADVSSFARTRAWLHRLRLYRLIHWTVSLGAPAWWSESGDDAALAKVPTTLRKDTPAERMALRGAVERGEIDAVRKPKGERGGKVGQKRREAPAGIGGPMDIGMSTSPEAQGLAFGRLDRNIEEIARRVRSEGAKMVLLTYPEEAFFGLGRTQLAAAERLDLFLADVGPAFNQTVRKLGRDRLISGDGHHPSGTGYAVMATCAYDAVRDAAASLYPPVPLAAGSTTDPAEMADYRSAQARAELDLWERHAMKGRARDAAVEYALMLADAGDFERAIEVLEEALEGNPGHALASKSLAHLYRRGGRRDAEISLCRHMLQLDPRHEHFRRRLAELESGTTGQQHPIERRPRDAPAVNPIR